MPRTCPDCGGKVRAAPNTRVERYKGLELRIPDVLVPTCEGCGEQFLDREGAEKTQAALEHAHQQVLYRQFMAALETVRKQRPAAAIERMLGYSQGYFSKLSRRERNLTTSLVAFLKLLANDPEHRLEELAQLFEEPLDVGSKSGGDQLGARAFGE